MTRWMNSTRAAAVLLAGALVGCSGGPTGPSAIPEQGQAVKDATGPMHGHHTQILLSDGEAGVVHCSPTGGELHCDWLASN